MDPSDVEFVLCDLDGVVWLNRRAIDGAPEAIARIRESGRRVLFVTNNSMSEIADQEMALAAIGVPAVDDVVTSAQAAASLVLPWERVHVCAGRGVVEAINARGATPVFEGPADVVMVGLHREFNYAGLDNASRLIRDGARFIATNDDATFPTPGGATPGGGALVAAVATAAGIRPTIAGKPHQPMAALVRERCGPTFSANTAVMVGDRYSTDGLFARTLGCPFAMVRSGVTPADVELDATPALDVADLAAVADVLVD
jgi:HAD superfamily hydrolase (TIGR01450 family)